MCSRNLDRYRALKDKIGTFGFSKAEPLLYSSPDIVTKGYVWIEFYCLVSIERWCFDKSSKVYIRFAAAELGTLYTCHGPMTLTKRLMLTILQKNKCYCKMLHMHVQVM